MPKSVRFPKGSSLEWVHELEADLGLQTGFFNDLLAEDDWTFVIKLHALLEAAFTHALTETFGRPELKPILARLELGNLTTGKLVFAERLGVIDRDTKRFILKLSELRNKFVHDPRNASHDIAGYLGRLDQSDSKGFATAFTWGYKSATEVQIRQADGLYDLAAAQKAMAVAAWQVSHRVAIWVGAMICIRAAYQSAEIERLTRQEVDLSRKVVASLMKAFADIETRPTVNLASRPVT